MSPRLVCNIAYAVMRRELREDLAMVPYEARVKVLDGFDDDLAGFETVEVDVSGQLLDAPG